MFETISEGFVNRRGPGDALPVAAGPRLALTARGEVLCTFMVQSALGVNDFVPVIARSMDLGVNWTEPAPLFPHLAGRASLFGSIGPGRLPEEFFFHGIRIPIDTPGESFWCEATQGMKQNGLFWSRATGGGGELAWSEPAGIPLDGPGSAEAPCPLRVTRSGRWIACYSPYNTFDPSVRVDRQRVVVACSDDRGRSWFHRDAMRFAEPESGGAEAWVVELADGRLLATAWHVDHDAARRDYPNTFALSVDGGDTWSPSRSTGIQGQSTALTPLRAGNALFVYNQRKHGKPGVRIACVNPSAEDFGVSDDQLVWAAAAATQHASSAGHAEWTDFSFGEPALAVLPDATLLLVFWCIQADGSGIRFLRLRAAKEEVYRPAM